MTQQCKTCNRVLVDKVGEYCDEFCRLFPRGEWRQALGTTWKSRFKPLGALHWENDMRPPGKMSPLPKIPVGTSVAFYKALKKAGYSRDPVTGDYQ